MLQGVMGPQAFLPRLFASAHIECLLQGNLRMEDAADIAQAARAVFSDGILTGAQRPADGGRTPAAWLLPAAPVRLHAAECWEKNPHINFCTFRFAWGSCFRHNSRLCLRC